MPDSIENHRATDPKRSPLMMASITAKLADDGLPWPLELVVPPISDVARDTPGPAPAGRFPDAMIKWMEFGEVETHSSFLSAASRSSESSSSLAFLSQSFQAILAAASVTLLASVSAIR